MVTVAQTSGNNIGISSGLKAGDVVVIDGQDKLQENSKVIANAAPTGGTAGGAAAQPAAQSGPQSGNPPASQSGGKAR
jgi:multidrug efflux system membrane fusion protein